MPIPGRPPIVPAPPDAPAFFICATRAAFAAAAAAAFVGIPGRMEGAGLIIVAGTTTWLRFGGGRGALAGADGAGLIIVAGTARIPEIIVVEAALDDDVFDVAPMGILAPPEVPAPAMLTVPTEDINTSATDLGVYDVFIATLVRQK